MSKRVKKNFKSLSKANKQKILDWIVETDSSITTATQHFNLTITTIDKIFEERFKPPKWVDDYKTFNLENK